jgi:hypothetical protein
MQIGGLSFREIWGCGHEGVWGLRTMWSIGGATGHSSVAELVAQHFLQPARFVEALLALQRRREFRQDDVATGFLPVAQIQPLTGCSTTCTSEKPALARSSRCSSTLRSVAPSCAPCLSNIFEAKVFAPL